MLKEIFSCADCARCRLCCNFRPESDWESPFLPPEQAARIQAQGMSIKRRPRGGWSFAFRFNGDEPVNCPMLDPVRGCRFSPEEKPFECRIWPLRLMTDDDRLVIGRYRDCPAMKNGGAEKLDRLLRERLLPILLKFAEDHPESIRLLAPEYEIVWRADAAGIESDKKIG